MIVDFFRAFLKRNWVSLLALSLVFSYILWQRMPQYLIDQKLIEKTSSDFVLENSVNKERLSLYDLRGKKVLLYFFASWCGSCRLQTSSIEKIYEENRKNEGEDFYLLAISEESLPVLKRYQKEKQLSYPLFRDLEGRAHDQFQIRSYPSMVWIESDGKVRDIEHGLNLLLAYSVRRWLKGSFFAL